MAHRPTVFATILLLAACSSDDARPSGPAEGTVLVSGGVFMMGTDTAEWAALAEQGVPAWAVEAERPAHTVRVTSFRLDATEVTNQAFAEFVAANPAWRRDSLAAARHNGRYLEHWPAADVPAATTGDEPVRFVTWHAASAFCRWRAGRLPRESEWEYAARAGQTGDVYPWGIESPDSTRARYGTGSPVAVASYAANPLGVHDLAGNVWEFVDDVWRATYAEPVSPAALVSASVPTSNVRRVIRGGSYEGAPVNMRVRFRDSHPALDAGPHVGFRCAYPAI